jgi:hypothetical protein
VLPSGNEDKEEQPEKASSLMVSMLSEIFTFDKLVQLLNMRLGMLVIFAFIIADFKLPHPTNVSSPILVVFSGIIMLPSCPQFRNAAMPISFNEEGSQMFSRLLHPLKASLLIVSNSVPWNMTFFRFEKTRKEFFPIE